MKHIITACLIYILFSSGTSIAQPVPWASLPSGHPHELYSSQKLPEIITFIAPNASGNDLYQLLYTLAFTTSDDQTQRSHIVKAASFVLATNQTPNGTTLPQSDISTLSAKIQQYFAELDPTVLANTSEYQWYAIQLMQFCQAYDMYAGATTTNLDMERALAAFARNAYPQIAFQSLSFNNLTAKLAAALGTAALTLHDSSNDSIRNDAADWMETSMIFIETVLFDYQCGTNGEAGYSEGPYYFRYAMMSLIPFFTSIDNMTEANGLSLNGSDYVSPLRDPRYMNIFHWIASLRMPDGRLPAFEDTYMFSRFPELEAIAALVPGTDFLGWKNYDGLAPLPASSLYSSMSETYDFRLEYLCTFASEKQTPAETPCTYHSPDAGYTVSRSSWDADATYFAMIGKHDKARTGGSAFGSGHKHANETAFILYSGGELLAMEPAYYQYDFRDSLIYGKNHNIILVDGEGPDRKSLTSFIIGVDAYISDTITTSYTSIATVETTYENTDISRTSVFFDNNCVVLRDKVHGSSSHTYTHQIHGNGLESAGTFTSDFQNGAGFWEAGNMGLHARVSATNTDPVYDVVTRKHAPQYRVFEDHSAMYSSVQGTDATFHTILIPSSVSENNSLTPIQSAANIDAVEWMHNGHGYLSVANESGALTTVSAIAGTVTTDASLFVLGTQTTGVHTVFAENTTSIILNGTQLYQSSAPATTAIHLTGNVIDITIDGETGTNISLYMDYIPASITGIGFTSGEMQGHALPIVLTSERMTARIILSSTPTGISDIPSSAQTAVLSPLYPNPASQYVSVPVSVSSQKECTLTLYSLLGEKVYTQHRMATTSGTQHLTYNLPPDIHGLYKAVVTVGNIRNVQTLFVR